MLTKTHIEAFVNSQQYRDAIAKAVRYCLSEPKADVRRQTNWYLSRSFNSWTQSYVVDSYVNAVLDRATAEVQQKLAVEEIRNSAFQLRWARALRLHQAWTDAGLIKR